MDLDPESVIKSTGYGERKPMPDGGFWHIKKKIVSKPEISYVWRLVKNQNHLQAKQACQVIIAGIKRMPEKITAITNVDVRLVDAGVNDESIVCNVNVLIPSKKYNSVWLWFIKKGKDGLYNLVFLDAEIQ
jgi:hypothetical protein